MSAPAPATPDDTPSFNSAQAKSATRDRRFLKICIASPEFVGDNIDGETGAGDPVLARALAAAGHQVTCLFLGPKDLTAEVWQQWVEKYRRDGVTLVSLPQINGSDLLAPSNLIRSYETYHWLKKNDRFDIIHFPDRQGPGYHTATAKHHGLAFARTTICIGMHSLRAWLNPASQGEVDKACEVDTDFMERRAVALADALVSPNQNLLHWITDHNWDISGPPNSPGISSGTAQAIQALSVNPTDIVALKTLARVQLNAGLPEAAEEACQFILKRHPGDTEALQMIEEAKALKSRMLGGPADNQIAAQPPQEPRGPESGKTCGPGLGSAFA